MKKVIVVLASLFALLLSGCLPFLAQTPKAAPAVNTTGTSDALFSTAVVQTLTAQPTLTPLAVADTATLPAESLAVDTVMPTFTPFETFTVVANLTTPTAAKTASPSPTNKNVNATATTTLVPGQPAPVWTLAVRTYGTLPPDVPFSKITLINKSKAEAYISLHVDLANGSNTVIEYPVEGSRKIKAPIGPYRYVAWVGGRKMMGTFRLTSDDITITLYKDKVTIK